MRFQIVLLVIATIIGFTTSTRRVTRQNSEGQYTAEERNALDELTPMVTKYLSSDFMKSDEYLILWLREHKLDVPATKQALLATLKWRKDTNIKASVDEDFSDFDKKYPFNIDGVDREGRPVLIAPAGSWRPRQAVLGGQVDRYNRFMTRTMLEIPLQKIEELHNAGKNVSQYVLVFDLNGVNAREHLCLQCLTVYSSLTINGERHYPRLAFKTFFINTPRIFDTAMQVLRPLMTGYTKDNLHLLDHNRDKWQSQLLEFIDADELPPRYGGSKEFKPNDYYAKSYEALSGNDGN